MTEAPGVLLVDDDSDLLRLLRIRLNKEGFRVTTAESGPEALKKLSDLRPAAVVTDLRMEGMDGMQLMTEIVARHPTMPVVFLTAHGTIPEAVKATTQGAFAFLTKPIDQRELIRTLHAAVATPTSNPSTNRDAKEEWRAGIVTQSPLMETVLREAALAAASDASILLQGESGTGKELLARAIHRASPRSQNAFIPVNCSAIPESLFESEMFGHVKGSFTGAHRDKTGLFAQANRGTLFLDEIGDLPQASQIKLLRALQENAVHPVGSDEDVPADVRVIAATHRKLDEAVSRQDFREDLYYRLNVIQLDLPPLSKRREDIPLLVKHFLEHFREEDKNLARGFSTEAMQTLVSARWPGNVRQLSNVVQNCMVLCRSRLIPLSLVERAMQGKAERLIPLASARDQFELEYLTGLLKATAGNVSQAARIAERNRTEFYKLLKKHGLEPADYRNRDPDG